MTPMGTGELDSRWWYGVALAGLLEIAAFSTPVVLQETGLYTQEMLQQGTMNVFAALGAYMMLGVPVSILLLAVCAHQDATAVTESALPWDPNPKLWAVAGVVAPILGLVIGTAGVWAVALVYLVKRFRAGGTIPIPAVR